jgi:hypothetical protein
MAKSPPHSEKPANIGFVTFCLNLIDQSVIYLNQSLLSCRARMTKYNELANGFLLSSSASCFFQIIVNDNSTLEKAIF